MRDTSMPARRGTGWVAAAGLLVAGALVAGCGSAGPRPRVLGVALTLPTSTTAPAPLATGPGTTLPATTVAAPPATHVTPRPTVATTARPTTSTLPPATTSTTAGESLAAGTYVERTDVANSFYVSDDGRTETTAIALARRDAPERVDLTVMYYGERVEVQLTNLAGRTIVLPDGYRAAVECRRDGAPWRTGDATSPAVTAVEPSATVSAVLGLVADGPGTYVCTATTTIVLPG